MDTMARWDLTVRRNDDLWSVPLRVPGLDLTGVALHAQIRGIGDSPVLLLDLPGSPVIGPAPATSVRLDSVTMTNGVPTSLIYIQIAKADRQALPYQGQAGDTAVLVWGLTIAGISRIQGDVFLPAQAVGADGAPANRAPSYAGVMPGTGSSSNGATLTIAQDGGATLVIDGAAVVAGFAAQAVASGQRADAAAAQAAALVASLGGRLSALSLAAPPGFAFAVSDPFGNVVLGIRNDGTPVVGSMAIGGASIVQSAPPGYVFALSDAGGLVALGLRTDGVLVGNFERRSAVNSAGIFMADVVGFFIYGQSLATGQQAVPSISTAQRFDNLTFDGGVRSVTQNNAAASRQAFAPLVENDVTNVSGGPAGETPSSGAGEALKELIAAENRLLPGQQSFQMLASAPGFGGITIGDLQKGQPAYTRFMNDVQSALTLAQAAGKTFKMAGFSFLQGENNTGIATWPQALAQLVSDINTDVKAITGQIEDVLCIAYQGVTEDMSIAIRVATKLDPRIIIAAPIYQLPKADGVHFTARSSKIWGALAGRTLKRAIVDAAPIRAIEPSGIFRQGNIAEVAFANVVGGLRFDTSSFPARPNYGFHLFAADGTTELTITSVTITQPNRVRITCSAAIPAGAVLRYGLIVPTNHGQVMANIGGNLCDHDPTVIDPAGGAYALTNWALMFQETIQ